MNTQPPTSDYTCSECSRILKSKAGLTRHLNMIHLILSPTQLEESYGTTSTSDYETQLDDILDRFKQGCDPDFHISIRHGRTKVETKQAIDDLLHQEVQKARLDEHKIMNARFCTVKSSKPELGGEVAGYNLCRNEWSRVSHERIAQLKSKDGADHE